MLTQKFKSVNLRTIVMNALQGRPVNNVHSHTLYDIEQDIDDDTPIIDEYSDKLHTIQSLRDLAESKHTESQTNKEEKGGMENEPSQKKNEPSQDVQA